MTVTSNLLCEEQGRYADAEPLYKQLGCDLFRHLPSRSGFLSGQYLDEGVWRTFLKHTMNSYIGDNIEVTPVLPFYIRTSHREELSAVQKNGSPNRSHVRIEQTPIVLQ